MRRSERKAGLRADYSDSGLERRASMRSLSHTPSKKRFGDDEDDSTGEEKMRNAKSLGVRTHDP